MVYRFKMSGAIYAASLGLMLCGLRGDDTHTLSSVPYISTVVHCKAHDGFFIAPDDVAVTAEQYHHIPATELTVKAVNGQILVNKLKTRRAIIKIIPVQGVFDMHGTIYEGGIRLRCVGDQLECTFEYNVIPPILPHVQPLSGEGIPKHTTQTEEKVIVTKENKKQYQVRVLLDDSVCNRATWSIASDDGFIVVCPGNPPQQWATADTVLCVSVTKRGIFLGDKKCPGNHLVIVPHSGISVLGNRRYHGVLRIVCQNDRVMLINCLDLEAYVACVLKTESWPGWPLEVNKAFAVACRSYALAMIMRAQGNKVPYHIKNTTHHQTYQGAHDIAALHTAVEQTRGVFLAYEGTPILAMFDCCCGGIIPAHIADFDFSRAPYLARQYACTHCKRYKIYSWKKTHHLNSVQKALSSEFPTIGVLKDVRVTRRDKAGLVQQVKIVGSRSSVTITGKKLRSLIDGVVSFCFSLRKRGTTVEFYDCFGYGHHMGLCQWGARAMVADGYDYRTTLEFYFPDATFMRLNYEYE